MPVVSEEGDWTDPVHDDPLESDALSRDINIEVSQSGGEDNGGPLAKLLDRVTLEPRKARDTMIVFWAEKLNVSPEELLEMGSSELINTLAGYEIDEDLELTVAFIGNSLLATFANASENVVQMSESPNPAVLAAARRLHTTMETSFLPAIQDSRLVALCNGVEMIDPETENLLRAGTVFSGDALARGIARVSARTGFPSISLGNTVVETAEL